MPIGHIENGVRLGPWVNSQRTSCGREELPLQRVKRLESISGWVWDARDTWDENFNALVRFVAREGHARVPTIHIEDGFRLGQWVVNQRALHARGMLGQERVKRLGAVSGWAWHTRDARWDENFDALARFVKREGHARVPVSYVEDGMRLGQWVINQRARHARGQLPHEREKRLEAVPGWTWDANEARWEDGFDVLVRFVEREGHARMPANHMEDGYRLGRWVAHQREFRREGSLSDERSTRLESLPGWVWQPRAEF